jgi:AsmA protein
MGKVIKWLCIVVGGLLVLVILALLIVPSFVDIQKYKPQIEEQVSSATGRPFTLGGELDLSLFPWVGVSLSDLRLGNPAGFAEKDFVTVKSFEVRVKLLPLIGKDIQVKRFILAGPRIVLERAKDGRVNWEGIGKASKETAPAEAPKKAEEPSESAPLEGLPIKALAVSEFAITDGSVVWIDQGKGEKKEVSDVTVRLKNVTLDRPIPLSFSALLDGQPLSMEGTVGPVGKTPGKGNIPVDLSLNALKQLDLNLKGKIVDPAVSPQFDLAIQLAPFSPRKLMAGLGQGFPVETTDPEVLNLVGFKATVAGDPQRVSVSDGVLNLDQSTLKFSVKAKDFMKPDVAFDLDLDEIDVDRYLPPKKETKPAEGEKAAKKAPAAKEKTDYRPLRKLVLDGAIHVGKLKAQGLTMTDLTLKVTGKNGQFKLDPLTVNLYKGALSARGAMDVRQDTPKSNMELDAKGIQAGPLLKDLLQKEFLEGTTQSRVAIRMTGDDGDRIKKSLNGTGEFNFTDGAIVGIDLAGMVRNAAAAFGLAEKATERPRTDFTELKVPFTITDGVVMTPNTALLSPLLRLKAKGKANLVKEDLDFRVEPKFVGTIKGQGDSMERSGLMVPVLVTGTFDAPKFRPDMEGILKQSLEGGLPKADELKKLLPGQGSEKGDTKALEEKAKDLLKAFPFGKKD